MNDYQFCDFVHNYYNIKLNMDDYIEIYSKTNNKNYYHIPYFKTNVISEIASKSDDKVVKQSWYLPPVKVGYEVFLDRNFNYDFNKEYSFDEIVKLKTKLIRKILIILIQ